jgi:hypothetical protein
MLAIVPSGHTRSPEYIARKMVKKMSTFAHMGKKWGGGFHETLPLANLLKMSNVESFSAVKTRRRREINVIRALCPGPRSHP